MTPPAGKSLLTGQSIVVSFDDDPERKLLIVEWTIDCGACGQSTFRMAGHHLPSLLKFLGQVVEDHPELIGGSVADVEIVNRMSWQGRPHGRAEDN